MEEKEEELIEDIEDEREFAELGQLKVSAPENVQKRLEKRVRVAQVGKDLVEKQAFAFWTVIDAFLRLIFVPHKEPEEKTETGEK